MNPIGVVAFVAFFICGVGALIAFLALRQLTTPRMSADRTWDRNDPKAQRRFLIFFVFCMVGVLSGFMGFLFGGWPQSGHFWP